jgi:hypothetical protein
LHATLEEDAKLASNLVVGESDPELQYIKVEHRDEFKKAFRESVAALSQHDRLLLRMHFVDQLTPGRIGEICGVHRTTAIRWLEAAQAAVLEKMRPLLIERLRLSPSACYSLPRSPGFAGLIRRSREPRSGAFKLSSSEWHPVPCRSGIRLLSGHQMGRIGLNFERRY